MSLMRESDPRFAHLERKVGLFVLLSLAVVAGAVVIAGVRQGLFTPKAGILFYDDSARDLAEGTEVVTRGFRIGKIAGVSLLEDGRVEVRVSIDRSFLRWIRQDSTARLAAKPFIVGSRIEISPGTPEAPPLPEGGTILFQRDPDVAEVAKKALEDVKPVLLAVKSLIEYLDDPEGDVKLSIANVNRLSAGLLETRSQFDQTLLEVSGRMRTITADLEALTGEVRRGLLPKVDGLLDQSGALVADAGRATRTAEQLLTEDVRGLTKTVRDDLLPQVRRLLASTESTLETAGKTAATVDRELPEILESVRSSLGQVQEIMEQILPVARQAGPMVEESQALIEDSQALIRRTGELWPFRTWKKTPGKTIDVDSYAPPPPERVGAPGAGGR